MNYTLPVDLQAGWPVVAILLVWSLVWKGLALWRAAKKDDKWWFLFILVINTAGILEILYLYVFSKRKALRDRAQS